MIEQHISSAFDRDIEAILAQLMRMGGLTEAAILEAASALEHRDIDRAERVKAGDKAIDELEAMIGEEITRLIALRAPTAIDLRFVLGVLRITANLERIGDYSKNIAKRTHALAQLPTLDDGTAALRRMAREVQGMLKDALDALVARDVDLACDVIERDRDLDQMYTSIFREFLTYMMEDQRNITACMHLHFIAKNIERMGDHVTSIAEQVVYTVNGEKPTDVRVKADRSSMQA